MTLVLAVIVTVIALAAYGGLSYGQGFHSGPQDPGLYMPAHALALFALCLWLLWFAIGGTPTTW
jgi:hypothetical protein